MRSNAGNKNVDYLFTVIHKKLYSILIKRGKKLYENDKRDNTNISNKIYIVPILGVRSIGR